MRDVLKGTPRFDTSAESARQQILNKLKHVETSLEGKRYLLGDAFTFADIALFTRIDILAALNIEVVCCVLVYGYHIV